MRLELAQYREKIRLSQSQIALNLGFTKSYYAKIEEGTRNPGFEFVLSFAKTYPDADIRYLFFNTKIH